MGTSVCVVGVILVQQSSETIALDPDAIRKLFARRTLRDYFLEWDRHICPICKVSTANMLHRIIPGSDGS